MPDSWESYPRSLDARRAVITVNTGFAARAETCPYPHLVSFSIAIQSPSEDGLAHADEMAALDALEDLLCAHIEPQHGVQVGRITTAGRRNAIFYASLPEQACWKLLDEVAVATGYDIDLSHQADAGLATYWNSLYPDLLDWQLIKDRRLQDALERQGDPLTQARTFDHWLYFPSAPIRERMVTRLQTEWNGEFQVARQYELQEATAEPCVLQLTHHGLPDQRSLFPYTAWLAESSHELGGRYDGWETEVIAPQPVPAPAQSLGEPPQTTTYVFDGWANQAAEPLVDLVQAGEYAIADTVLGHANDDEREELIYGFTTHEGSVFRAARWASACPHSAYALLALGASMLVTGWQIRGDDTADNVPPEAWRPFLDSLRDASEPLQRAARLRPDLPDAYGWLIQCAMGRGTDRDELQALFDTGANINPSHWPLHMKYALATSDKWYGSHPHMQAFAREASARAPVGSNVHLLVPSAYAELVLDRENVPLDSLRTEAHASQVREALHRWADLDSGPLMTRLYNQYGAFRPNGLNVFAVACYVTGLFDEARALISVLGGHIQTMPWAWLAQGEWERRNPALVHDRIAAELGTLAQPATMA